MRSMFKFLFWLARQLVIEAIRTMLREVWQMLKDWLASLLA